MSSARAHPATSRTSERPPRLRIALLAPLIAPIREPQIGGVATFLTDLALGLRQAGHDVHLFAASGSQLDGITVVDTGVAAGDLASTLFRPLAGRAPADRARSRAALARTAFGAAYRKIAAGGYDVVHNHAFDAPAIELARDLDSPVVHTLHLPPDPLVSEALRAACEDKHPPVVAAVSGPQRRAWEAGNNIDVLLRPGIPTARIPWSASTGDAVVFAGRLSPEKGVLEAIEIARGSGRELLIAGTRYDESYAEEVDRAALRAGGVRLVGPLPRTELWRLMTGSAALIFPILWEEPFGLVAAEAQATGCPVIGFRGGALAEVIDDGVTGAVVERGDIEGARDALTRLDRYGRSACRERAERLFDVGPVIATHVALYEEMAGAR